MENVKEPRDQVHCPPESIEIIKQYDNMSSPPPHPLVPQYVVGQNFLQHILTLTPGDSHLLASQQLFYFYGNT